MKGYEWVQLPTFEPEEIVKIYGKSKPGLSLMPVGENGKDIWARVKQTEADRLECIKRGAT